MRRRCNDMKGKKSLNNLRDCVKEAFYKGSSRGYEFRTMRLSIIRELQRLGFNISQIKDKLIEWNERCERPLNISEQRNQLLKYVDWAEENKGKVGCNYLEDFCVGKEKCEFYKRITYHNRENTQELPFNIEELEKFLIERFRADAYIMILTVKALRRFQIENATGEIIYIGYRRISSIIRDQFGHSLLPMDIFRKMKVLIEEKVIEQVATGKSGDFSWQANGYRFLSWKPPIPTHINTYE